MDVHCCNCGEPWDQHHLRHDLADSTAEDLASEGWEFGSNRLVILHCPCCPPATGLPDAKERSAIVQDLADLLGDDEDGLASTLNDFDL